MAAKSTIRKHLRQLRHVIETSTDPVETRVAYVMECAVRWAIEDTDWPGLADDAKRTADLIRCDLSTSR